MTAAEDCPVNKSERARCPNCDEAKSVKRSYVKAQTHTVELLAQVANRLQCAVAAHGCNRLEDLQQVLALEGQRQAAGRAGHIDVGAEEHRFHLDGGIGRVIGIGAAQGNTPDIGGKLMILSELELGVVGIDAQGVVNRQQFLLAGLGSNSATSLGQQVLAREGATRLSIVPGAIKVALIDIHATDN